MLRRLALRDFVIVPTLEVEFDAGFTVLTGETGAGKSILVDALQLLLGARSDAIVVREGAARAEVSAEFDALPEGAVAWLDEAGFDAAEPLLVRRTVDAQGKSRAWIAGSAATVGQLKELGEWLIDIHGQHAWQSLARGPAVRSLLDGHAGIEPGPLARAWAQWRTAREALEQALARQDTLAQERERLAWQLSELDRLAPGEAEWDELNTEHQRLSHVQTILAGMQTAIEALAEGEPNALQLTSQAQQAVNAAAAYDAALSPVGEVLETAHAHLSDALHTLQGALRRTDLDPDRLARLDARLAEWVGLARRWRRPPQELAATRNAWRLELHALESAIDTEALAEADRQAERAWRDIARRVSAQRRQAAPRLARSVTEVMQALGMAGGRFDVALHDLNEPQPHGLESVEFLVAGHAGATPRPLGKVASGGELSRIALAVAVTTSRLGSVGTLIFDEIDAGVGGAVAETVGRLMQQLGRDRQVLAVTHLAQVAACADHQWVVSKQATSEGVTSRIEPMADDGRAAEIARMLGGPPSPTSLAHARELLARQATAAAPSSPLLPKDTGRVGGSGGSAGRSRARP